MTGVQTCALPISSATAEAKDATEPDAPEQADDPAGEATSVNGQVTTNR